MKGTGETQVDKTEDPAAQNDGEFVNLGRRTENRRLKFIKIFMLGFGIVAILTVPACLQNANNSRTNEQLPSQQNSASVTENKTTQTNINPSPQFAETLKPPEVFKANCAKCHGENGEGTKKYPELKGVTAREEDPLSEEDLLATINDAKSLGLSSKMPSFQNKLTEEEKLEIIKWLKTLK